LTMLAHLNAEVGYGEAGDIPVVDRLGYAQVAEEQYVTVCSRIAYSDPYNRAPISRSRWERDNCVVRNQVIRSGNSPVACIAGNGNSSVGAAGHFNPGACSVRNRGSRIALDWRSGA